ncbi:MAG: hypothetical protein VKM01_05670 [Cyanobacteriota bacterium]|nr:hypothetical protein [Cyanobacteriota bacterium]
MFGLYDHQGVLRYAGRDLAECLDYANLFALAPDSYSVADLIGDADLDGASIGTSLLPIG